MEVIFGLVVLVTIVAIGGYVKVLMKIGSSEDEK